MSAGSTDSTMSISEARIIVPRTWWTHSQMAFAWGFLNVVGLRFMPYDLHNVSQCNLNLDPLSWIKYWHHGYLHNQILLTNQEIWLDDLSKISSLLTFSLQLTNVAVSWLTSGNSTISNQLEAGWIMVSAMKSTAEPSLPLSVYEPIKSTHKAYHGVLITVLDGRWPYFSWHLLLTWHDLHDLVIDWTVFCISFQYIMVSIVPSRRVCPRCWK